MKMNFSFTNFYILYMALALCLYPVKNAEVQVSEMTPVVQAVEEKPLAVHKPEILHEELLFENAGF